MSDSPAVYRTYQVLHDCQNQGHWFDSLYPHSVYQCQNQGCANFEKYFRTGKFRGAVTWNCPTCSKPGKYIGRQCSYCRHVERPAKP